MTYCLFKNVPIGTKFSLPWTSGYSIKISQSVLEKTGENVAGDPFIKNAKYIKTAYSGATTAHIDDNAMIEVIE